ncbi:discoidin domain-containing protein [Mycobacterium kansasii]
MSSDSSVTDVFVAHRARILAILAPRDNQTSDGSSTCGEQTQQNAGGQSAAPQDDLPAETDGHDYADGGVVVTSFSSAGFLQFASADDLDEDHDADPDDDSSDDNGIDDDDSDDAPGPLQLNRWATVRQKLSKVNWKSTKVRIGGLAATVAIVGLVVVVFKHEPPGPAPLMISAAPASTTTPPTTPLVDGPIKIASSTAKCPGSGEDSSNAFDGQLDTAWVCKTSYGPGQKLVINLGEPYVISRLTIVPGFNKFGTNGDQWTQYQTVTRIRWLFGAFDPNKPCNLDNNCLETNTDNRRESVPVFVTPNKTASVITMVVLKTTPPPNSGDLLNDHTGQADSFAVSEIQVIGHRPQ